MVPFIRLFRHHWFLFALLLYYFSSFRFYPFSLFNFGFPNFSLASFLSCSHFTSLFRISFLTFVWFISRFSSFSLFLVSFLSSFSSVLQLHSFLFLYFFCILLYSGNLNIFCLLWICSSLFYSPFVIAFLFYFVD